MPPARALQSERACSPGGSRASRAAAAPGSGGSRPAQRHAPPHRVPPGALACDVGAGGFVVLGNFFSGGALTWMPTSGRHALGGHGGRGQPGRQDHRRPRARRARPRERRDLEGGTDWRLLGSFTAGRAALRPAPQRRVRRQRRRQGRRRPWLERLQLAHAFRWEESTGMVDLGSTNAGESSRANNVSGDGRVVVGWQEHATGFRQGAKWIEPAAGAHPRARRASWAKRSPPTATAR